MATKVVCRNSLFNPLGFGKDEKSLNDLKLKEIYHEFEEKRASEIRDMINNVDESEGLKKEVFEVFLSKIYKRTK